MKIKLPFSYHFFKVFTATISPVDVNIAISFSEQYPEKTITIARCVRDVEIASSSPVTWTKNQPKTSQKGLFSADFLYILLKNDVLGVTTCLPFSLLFFKFSQTSFSLLTAMQILRFDGRWLTNPLKYGILYDTLSISIALSSTRFTYLL